MSTETLDRLAAIIDGLSPIGGAGPGEPVRADQWNTLVGGVQELAKIAVARERSAEEVLAANFAKVDHGHESTVDLTWFDPDTRSMIEGGRAQRADLAAELERVQRDLAEARAAIQVMRDEVAAMKDQVDGVDDRDRDRATSLDRLSVRVESFTDNATSIADLRSTLGGIDGRVGESLAFRNELVDETGAPIDMAVLRRDVTELRQIRENLTAADGRLVEYRDFERRVAAVEDELERITPGGEGPGFDLEGFRAEILDATNAMLDPRLSGIESGIGNLETTLEVLDPRVAEATDGVTKNSETLATHGAQIGALQATTATLPSLTTRVGTVENRLATHDARFASLEQLPDRMTKAEQQLEALPSIDRRLAENERGLAATRESLKKMDELEVRIAAIEGRDLGEFDIRFDVLEASLAETNGSLSENGERLVVLESRSDDQVRRFAEIETLGKANREMLTLLAREVDDIRTGGRRPPIGPVIPAPGGPIVQPPRPGPEED